jgi:MOSC domain-containing protein YiiM
VLVERCDECRFDGSRWTDQDVLTTVGILRVLWDLHVEGVDERVLQTRPSPDRWSIAEYADHVRETLFGARFLVDSALGSPGIDLGDAPATRLDATPRLVDLPAALDRLGDEAVALHDRLTAVPTDEWPDSTVTIDGRTVDLGWIGRHAIHDASHHLHDVGRIRVALGDGARPRTGAVAHLAVSGGGAPKHGVDSFEVGWSGALGDTQGDRRHHGRPFQALCLWSTEIIAGLQADGHPIAAGLAGENVTVTGLDWADLHPGTIVQIGGAQVEISSQATPCAKNAQWFTDRAFDRIDHDLHPGLSRLYATVLDPGPVAVGDQVLVEP